MNRHGKQNGTRQMIELLQLGRHCGREQLRQAIEAALAAGCSDAAAVKHLLHAQELSHVVCQKVEVGFLERYERPLPVMADYDQLLMAGGVL